MKLNKKTYFTKSNLCISNSKIKDWLKDKNYFYRKHYLHEIPQKVTDSLVIGSAVDCWLTRGEKEFLSEYIVVTKRDTKADNYRYQLNDTMYRQVEKMCRSVLLTSAFSQLRGFKKQLILQHDMDLGIFTGICAIPDWYKEKLIEDTLFVALRDLKTAEEAQSARKYFYKCDEYGYFSQFAMQQLIIELNNPDKKCVFDCRHLVVEKDPDEVYPCFIYQLSQDKIDIEKERIKSILMDIKNEKKFQRRDASWNDAVLIGESINDSI